MTKKDYEAVAKIIREVRSLPMPEAYKVECIAGRLADVFQKDNPRFDRARFLLAAR